MPQTKGRTMRWWVASAGALVVGLPVAAQDSPPLKTMLAWEHQSPSTWFPSEKDAGLVRAGAMLPERLREIFELEEMSELRENVPWPMVELALARLGGSMRFVATQQGFDPNTGAPQVGAIMSFGLPGGAEEGARMHTALEQMRAQFGAQMQIQPSQKFTGMNEMQLPFGRLAYGPRRAADGHRYEIHFGVIPDPDAIFQSLAGDDGDLDVIARGVIDLSAAAPFTAMGRGMIGMLGQQGRAMERSLAEMGVFGDQAIAIEYKSGYTATHGVETVRMRRARQYAEGLGLSDLTISREDLAAIPADATFAWVMKSDMAGDLDRFKEQMRPFLEAQGLTPEQAMEQIKAQTGFDVPAIVSAFGDTAALYLSDSTGGGTLMSGVLVARLADEPTARQALAQLAGMFNDVVAQQIDTRAFAVRLTPFEHEGVRYLQLRTPGLPVPLEPTIATTGEWLVAGLTAPAAAGAVHQIQSGSGSLASNAAFQGENVRLGEITQLVFIDSQRTLRDGYGAVGMLSSAVANAMRAPHGPRDPGLICPPYAQLADGVKPMLMTTFWDGDDYVTQSTGDRSMLVNAAGMLGVGDLGSFIGGAMIGAGVTGGAMNGPMGRSRGPVMWEIEDLDLDGPDF